MTLGAFTIEKKNENCCISCTIQFIDSNEVELYKNRRRCGVTLEKKLKFSDKFQHEKIRKKTGRKWIKTERENEYNRS